MRLSVVPGDKSYRPHSDPVIRHCRVFLDGVEQGDCVTADEEEGLVVRHVRIEGLLQMDEQGEVKIETARGKVEIKYAQ